MRKYNISTERSEKIMDILSKLNIISMKDYYSAIVTITKEEWDKIEEIFDKITTKMFETVKKTLEQTQEYSSSKATIYLEKDNGKWGVAELEEKLENYRQMYKISK